MKSKQPLVVYLVGSISENAGAFEQFEYWSTAIKDTGINCTILNAIEICKNAGAMDNAEKMKVCLEVLSEHIIDFVVLLRNWHTSEGAMLEEQYCRARGLSVVTIDDFMKLTTLL